MRSQDAHDGEQLPIMKGRWGIGSYCTPSRAIGAQHATVHHPVVQGTRFDAAEFALTQLSDTVSDALTKLSDTVARFDAPPSTAPCHDS